jgi:hypothetical protein
MEGDMNQLQVRHGDLLIVPVESVPSGCVVKEDNILAAGEVTGHHHRLSGGVVLEKGPDMFFEVEREARLTHEEHGPITFTPGKYKVIRQVEYVPDRAPLRVAD